MGILPLSFAIRTALPEGCYVVIETTEGNRQGCLVLSETASVFDSFARFAVEPASDGLVHIKSRYNNMYLCRKSEESELIAAAASERKENIAKWSCTLFRVEPRERELLDFYHTGTGKLVSFDWNGDIHGPLILPGPGDVAVGSVLTVDVEAIVRLPKRVSFKGDNGKYLSYHMAGEVPYNSFTRDDNIDQVSHYEIIENRHAEIRIKSSHTKKFLRYGDNGWIVADVASIEPEKYNRNEIFKVVKVGDNVIALRNEAGQFCKRVEDENGISWLRACNESYVEHQGRFVVGEPVFARRMDVQFQFKDAKIYGKEVCQTAAISVVNGTDEKHELSQGFSYTKTHSGTWGSSDQLEIGTEATLTAGVPFFSEATFKLSAAYTRTWTRGISEDHSKQLTSTYTVPVPAKTKVTVKINETKC
ncbi:uncharacterized protein LOC110692268 [Chenopodium quinoa]|uniref:uncharacterized protein LOC110692268 n=1 Tax=Chenopodium quinoa TaxID=63459 RepID=UPI000B77BD1E|nr:uncharacterized protein LOC110692268 [Chenopodium quinoa]